MLTDSLYGIKKASQLKSKAALQGLLSWLYLIVFAVTFLKAPSNCGNGRRSTAGGDPIRTERQVKRSESTPSCSKKEASISSKHRLRRLQKRSTRIVGGERQKLKPRTVERRPTSKIIEENLRKAMPRVVEKGSVSRRYMRNRHTSHLENNANPNPALFYPDSETRLFRNPNTNNIVYKSMVDDKPDASEEDDKQSAASEEMNKMVSFKKIRDQSNQNDTIYAAQREYEKLLQAFQEKHTQVLELQRRNSELQVSITKKGQQLSKRDELIREQQFKLERYENSKDVEERVKAIMIEHEDKITDLNRVWHDRKLELEKRIAELVSGKRVESGIVAKPTASGYISRSEEEHECLPLERVLSDTSSNTTTTTRVSSIGTRSLSCLSEEKSSEEVDDFDNQMAELVSMRKRNLRLESQLYGTADGFTCFKDESNLSILCKQKLFIATPGISKDKSQARLIDVQAETPRYPCPEKPQVPKLSAY